MSELGTIKLRRTKHFDSWRKLDVLVDGKKIGSIANGQEESFEIGSGRHTVQVKFLGRSELLDIDLSPNRPVELECGVSKPVWLTLPFQVVIGLSLINLLVSVYMLLHPLPDFPMPGVTVFELLLIAIAFWIHSKNSKPGGRYYLKRADGAQTET